MEEKTETRVVFRAIPNESRDVIAFLLDVPANYGMIMSYMHVGQHGEASKLFYYDCKPAKPEEYAYLKEELESIGYELKICKKMR